MPDSKSKTKAEAEANAAPEPQPQGDATNPDLPRPVDSTDAPTSTTAQGRAAVRQDAQYLPQDFQPGYVDSYHSNVQGRAQAEGVPAPEPPADRQAERAAVNRDISGAPAEDSKSGRRR